MTSRPAPWRISLWRIRAFAALALLPLLASCGGLLSSPPDRQLYRAIPSFNFPAGLRHVGIQLLVAAPSAPGALDTTRIALSRSAVSLDYFADAAWTDRAPIVVRDALVQGFERSGAIAAVAPEGTGLRGEFLLDTAIGDFQAVYDSPDQPPLVRVSLDVKLTRILERRIVAHSTVSGEQRAATNTLPDIVRAFGAALGEAAEKVVGWTVANPALSARP